MCFAWTSTNAASETDNEIATIPKGNAFDRNERGFATARAQHSVAAPQLNPDFQARLPVVVTTGYQPPLLRSESQLSAQCDWLPSPPRRIEGRRG